MEKKGREGKDWEGEEGRIRDGKGRGRWREGKGEGCDVKGRGRYK